MLNIHELFTSLQGESSHAGRRCFFIRLAGCRLDCSYCDTRHADSGTPMSIEALLQAARDAECKLVEITGGEPLEQAETPLLAQQLIEAGFEVLIETNGSCDISAVPPPAVRIVDCKLPGSGMEKHNLWSNFSGISTRDEVKFVVSDRADFDYAINVIKQYQLENKCGILFSPIWGKVRFDDLAQWILETRAPGRMQIQMHKIIWGADAKGV